MSIVRCEQCSRQIDSDFDLDCFTDDGAACEPCRENSPGYESATDREASEAANRDMRVVGTTCGTGSHDHFDSHIATPPERRPAADTGMND